MKQHKQTYIQPTMTVVHFKVEDGFQSVVNPVESVSPNFETVSENTSFSGNYGDYFTNR